MSRKHYIETARIIADEVEDALVTEHMRTLQIVRAETAAVIAVRLADMFKRDNPHFDRQRFYFACALDDNGRVPDNWSD